MSVEAGSDPGPLEAAAQPAKFLAVGAAGYLVNLGIFAGLYALGTHEALAAIASYFLANALMYLGNRYFTFHLGNKDFWGGYLRYMLVGLVVAGMVAGILVLLVDKADLDPRIANAVALLAVSPVAFVVFKRWSFRIKT